MDKDSGLDWCDNSDRSNKSSSGGSSSHSCPGREEGPLHRDSAGASQFAHPSPEPIPAVSAQVLNIFPECQDRNFQWSGSKFYQ